MYFAKKSEYNDIREKSFLQWLDEMEKHDDVAVRCGVKLAREYMQYLKDENEKLQEENELKNSYLKKMKMIIMMSVLIIISKRKKMIVMKIGKERNEKNSKVLS